MTHTRNFDLVSVSAVYCGSLRPRAQYTRTQFKSLEPFLVVRCVNAHCRQEHNNNSTHSHTCTSFKSYDACDAMVRTMVLVLYATTSTTTTKTSRGQYSKHDSRFGIVIVLVLCAHCGPDAAPDGVHQQQIGVVAVVRVHGDDHDQTPKDQAARDRSP